MGFSFNFKRTTLQHYRFISRTEQKYFRLQQLQISLECELAISKGICDVVTKHDYVSETTAAESSFQNAISKRPHCTLGNMMHSMITGAGLSNTFWANALLHTI